MGKLFTVLCCLFMFTAPAQEQKKLLSPKASSTYGDVSVTYGQPSKRGRVIFGGLVPYDSVWRTGANEATEITFKKDAVFAGKKIKAGTYTLFTIPSERQWQIILNKQLGQWGAYEYDKYKRKNVLRVTTPVYELKDMLEKLTITVKKDSLSIEWDRTGVAVPVEILK
ncbi:MAG: DUF2911 domain-containing protein [Chitinophagaceae bacterium]|nr:DUF2911 domain-containing protein [Chitinophagaceae bacterium]MCB9045045.1 DUF2911 domain-containing protein [Chitinophagales bacterium]